MENNVYVYRHRRLDTDEVFYIGIGIKNRAYQKGNRGVWWKRIISKTDYSIEIIANNLTREYACELEMLLIQEYGRKCTNEGSLINLSLGGGSNSGYKHTEISKLNMSISAKNKIVTEEARINMSISRGMKVINTETNIIYRSITHAANEFNISTTTLARYLKKTVKSKINYPFEYLDNVELKKESNQISRIKKKTTT